MTLFHKPIPLDAPKQEDEIEYTPLELSRLRRSAINFQRIVMIAIVSIVLASAITVVAVITVEANRGHDACMSSNHGRSEIKQAFANLYDGFIVAGADTKAAVDFKKTQMAKLDKGLPQRSC